MSPKNRRFLKKNMEIDHNDHLQPPLNNIKFRFWCRTRYLYKKLQGKHSKFVQSLLMSPNQGVLLLMLRKTGLAFDPASDDKSTDSKLVHVSLFFRFFEEPT